MRIIFPAALAGLLSLLMVAPAALAANSAIDPDPRSPSLGELLAREDAAREKAAPRPVAPPPVVVPAAPVAPPASVPGKTGVRQVYPQPAVTVLVPGGRVAPAGR